MYVAESLSLVCAPHRVLASTCAGFLANFVELLLQDEELLPDLLVAK